MAFGTFKTFGQIKDEDKYFRFFTKRNIAWTFVGGLIGFGAFSLLNAIGFSMAGAVTGITICVFFAGMSFVQVPVERYLSGGGLFLTTVVFRWLQRKVGSGKVIYNKFYDTDDEKEGRSWLS